MIALLALAAAAATGYGTREFDAYLDGRPPARYHHDTTVILHITTEDDIVLHCGPAPAGFVVVGCGDIPQSIADWQHPRNVYMQDPCLMNEVYAQRLCHELAHTLGWAQDHPR